MASSHEIAIAVLETAVDEFARRAGAASEPRPESPAWLRRAWELALGTPPTAAAGAPPALKSLPARLYGAGRDAFYAPQVMSGAASLPLLESPANLAQQYRTLWAEFARERDDLIVPGQSPSVLEANLLALLQRYTWAMAAPHTATPLEDVSLFDAARVAAAIAVCMQADEGSSDALLIGGDVSGVQEWLFTIGSGGAAKSLRGRSFYLQLLAELLAQTVLDRLDLPQANLLYAGGGNFYLLAPASALAQLEGIRSEIGERMLTMHQGALPVAIDAIPTPLAKIARHAAPAWDTLHRRLNRSKSRRFEELDADVVARYVGAALDNSGAPDRTCKLCGRTMAKGEKGEELEGGRKKCDLCLSFEQLGDDLRRARFIVLTRVEPAQAEVVTNWQAGLRALGYDVQLVRSAHEAQTVAWDDPGGGQATICFWNKGASLLDFPGWPGAERMVWSFRPLAQCVPVTADGEIADFDKIGKASDGIERWGVLRMDVDDLGQVFQKGLAGGSLCRVVGLSGLLRLFFEGRVAELGDKWNDGGQPRVYIMYAGGDDLFIVGAWSALPELAWEIRNDFARFAANNPKLTLSAGITIALDEKYPLYQAARDADKAEHAAKDLPGKDAVCFLGQAVKWDGGTSMGFASVRNRAATVRGWLTGEVNAPRSLIMNLLAIDAEWRQWKERESRPLPMGARNGPTYCHGDRALYLGPWQWHLAYSVARAGERSKSKSFADDLKQFVENIIGGEIEVLGLECRWVELLERQKQGKDRGLQNRA